MKKSTFLEEQIAYALRQVESGTAIADVRRQLGISEATFYLWRNKFAHLGVSELRRLRSLEEENARLKCESAVCARGADRTPLGAELVMERLFAHGYAFLTIAVGKF